MPAHIFKRTWGRILRIPLIGAVWTRIEDCLDTTIFWLRGNRRRSDLARLGRCETVADYFELAAELFGPHQIRTEITQFVEMAREERPQCVCEIGTAAGGTNFFLCHALPDVSLMLGVDLFVRGKARLRYFQRLGQKFCYLDGSSYAPETVEKARRLLNGRQLDVLFIDGDHTYHGVKEDFLHYRQFVREGGLIVFHDIVADHHTRYSRKTGRWAGEVPVFWSKIKPLYAFREFIEDPDQDGLGIGVIHYSTAVALPENL